MWISREAFDYRDPPRRIPSVRPADNKIDGGSKDEPKAVQSRVRAIGTRH